MQNPLVNVNGMLELYSIASGTGLPKAPGISAATVRKDTFPSNCIYSARGLGKACAAVFFHLGSSMEAGYIHLDGQRIERTKISDLVTVSRIWCCQYKKKDPS